MSVETRHVVLFAEDADWLWKERVPRENMAAAFARVRAELEVFREEKMKERFKKERADQEVVDYTGCPGVKSSIHPGSELKRGGGNGPAG